MRLYTHEIGTKKDPQRNWPHHKYLAMLRSKKEQSSDKSTNGRDLEAAYEGYAYFVKAFDRYNRRVG